MRTGWLSALVMGNGADVMTHAATQATRMFEQPVERRARPRTLNLDGDAQAAFKNGGRP